MKKLALLIVVVVFGVTASPAFGQATRTWVSGVGDDANPCSRTAPCKTFAGAISKTATGGIIQAMDDGGFGALTITKSITVDGGSHSAGMLASGGINAININLTSLTDTDKRVVLRNLNIEGNGTTEGLNGVSVANGGPRVLEMDNVTISQFSRHGIVIQPDASFQPTMSVVLNNVFVSDSGPGLFSNAFEVQPDAGVGDRQVNALIRNSVFKGSRPFASGGPGESGIGVAADTGAHVWLSNTAIFDNQIGVKTFARQGARGIVDSFCDNQIGGNVDDIDDATTVNELCPQLNVVVPPPPAPQTITQTVPITQCFVPSLKGLPVAFARRLLQAAHCALGTVSRQKTRKRRQIGKVIIQGINAGATLPEGTKVNVVVGRR